MSQASVFLSYYLVCSRSSLDGKRSSSRPLSRLGKIEENTTPKTTVKHVKSPRSDNRSLRHSETSMVGAGYHQPHFNNDEDRWPFDGGLSPTRRLSPGSSCDNRLCIQTPNWPPSEVILKKICKVVLLWLLFSQHHLASVWDPNVTGHLLMNRHSQRSLYPKIARHQGMARQLEKYGEAII